MGKKVNFVKDAVNKHFESVEELEDFIDEYAEECDKDFEFLSNMKEYMEGKEDDSSLTKEEMNSFIENQKKEFDEFMSHDNYTLKDLKEFLKLQDKDVKEFISKKFFLDDDDEEDDEEEDESDELKELIKQCIREVMTEDK